MQRQSIAISLLVSPKKELDYQKRNKFEFLQLVSKLRATRKVDVPIEVYPFKDGKYYIADGVHRAKAAELAKLDFIDAIIYTDSKPSGQTTPIKDVIVP
jgi:ParB-like chromosome segregation protein Spo0J